MADSKRRHSKGSMVKSRVTNETKRKVVLLASLRSGEEKESESLILREALAAYFERPEIKAQLAEALRREEKKRGGGILG